LKKTRDRVLSAGYHSPKLWPAVQSNDNSCRRGSPLSRTTIKTSIRLQREPNSTLAQFLDKDLVSSISAARIREEFRKLRKTEGVMGDSGREASHL
jgi:hypothetical protein